MHVATALAASGRSCLPYKHRHSLVPTRRQVPRLPTTHPLLNPPTNYLPYMGGSPFAHHYPPNLPNVRGSPHATGQIASRSPFLPDPVLVWSTRPLSTDPAPDVHDGVMTAAKCYLCIFSGLEITTNA